MIIRSAFSIFCLEQHSSVCFLYIDKLQQNKSLSLLMHGLIQ